MSTKKPYLSKLIPLFISAVISAAVVSCGGSSNENSSDTSSANNNNQGVQPNVSSNSNGNVNSQNDEPVQISSSNWRSSRDLNRAVAVTTTAYSAGNHTWSVTVTDDSISENDHLQVYLDTDNDATTGYQFDNEAWANKSGADYLIEDDILFESTASDDTWSWKYLVPVDITRSGNQIEITVPVSRFSGLCNTYNIGTIGMSDNWDIETFYPIANDMATKTIPYCDGAIVNTKPVITLADTTPINLALNANFVIPNATAYDEEDGDISSAIQSTSNVNTAQAGTYEINYNVSDSGNLAATTVKRLVIVHDNNTSDGFVIDGDSSDWSNISAFSQSNEGTLKVTDDENYLYILIDSSVLGANTQVLIDTDNNAATGTAIHGNGIDYMVENELLSKYIGSTVNEWAWDYGFDNIQFVRNQNILEMSIPKASLGNLADKINIGFKSLDADWIIEYSIPNSSDSTAYDLLHGSGQVQQDIVANPDAASTNYETAITIDILSNDTEQLGYTLHISQLSAPNNGSAVIVNHKVLYTPNSSFSGTDSFSYSINDGHGHTATAIITVIVGARSNTAPVATIDLANTENTVSVVIDVLANDSDAESDPLTITEVQNPTNGSVQIVNNKVVYTPNANYIGTETFTYTITDGSLTGTAIVTVVVTGNVAPVATNDSASTIRSSSVIIDVLANDADADNDSLIIISTQPSENGQVAIVANKIKYTPNLNFSGNDLFNYTISDGQGNTATASVTITVANSNQSPIAGEDAPTTEFNTPIEINVLANDSDPDGDTLTILSFTQPPVGVVTQVNSSTLLFDPQGNIASISFTYTVSDGHGGTDTAGVTVASNDPNDDAHAEYPTITNENITIAVGQSIDINVLANDFDPDGDTLNLDQVDDPDNGTTVKLGGGVVRYTPDPEFIGTDVFYYGVHDGYGHNGAGKVTITVILGSVN